jgi:hypothetical protein
MDQERPSQHSTSELTDPSPPTAVQARPELHEIADRLVAPTAGGTASIDHLEPFQRSTNGYWLFGEVRYPTAWQTFADVHSTSVSVAADGLGVLWIDQLEPFQRSTSAPREKDEDVRIVVELWWRSPRIDSYTVAPARVSV